MATGAQTPRHILVADWIGNAIALCVWGFVRISLAGLLCSPIVLAFEEGQPGRALPLLLVFLLSVLPFVLHLLWMPDAGLAVSSFYGRCLRWLWRLIVPAPLRRSGAAYLERQREARARAKAKAAERAAREAQLAQVARAPATKPRSADGGGTFAALGCIAVALLIR